ncbi:hypothetical protein GN958_ATG04245 [Phytophthora infestans]|uniref:Uncharacterized protein n=1 Tax=Phytophthora infestans TaxID=4787 RepID=A0A8S9V184_PHYIN|nr:hypothetical protein GN958_ATG04245 [Phytophthora infestans]
MQKYHADALHMFEESARLAEELKNSKQFKNLFESTGESAQSRFEGILAGWIGRDMRPASIVHDPGFAQAIAFANSAQEPLSCAAHSLHLVVAAALMMKSEERTSKVAVDADGTVISDTAQASSISTDVSGIDCVLNTLESHLAHYSWIDERLEALENCADDGDELDEFVSAADIDSIFAQVAAFVADVEKVVASEVSSIDMESARQSVCNFRSLAEYFRRSQKGSNRLNHCQLSRKAPLKVKIDCPTRWNSTLDMLQRFVELQSLLYVSSVGKWSKRVQ